MLSYLGSIAPVGLLVVLLHEARPSGPWLIFNVSQRTVSDTFDAAPPVLEVGALQLRPMSIADAPAIHAFASDPEVARFTLWQPHGSEAVTSSFLSALCSPMFVSWTIVMKESQTVVGMVFLHSFSKRHQKAEIAFHVAPQHWRHGLATESARTVLNFAFERLGLHRVEATCMPANVGSRRVLEKIGMSKEGTMRRSHFRYDGFHDMDLLSILRDEKRG